MTVRILVCDDNISFAARLTHWLRENSPREVVPDVCTCTDPGTLSEAGLSAFDILFLDIDMGRCSGIEVARRLRRVQARSLLIFVTNYVEYSPEGYEVGAFRFLLKSRLEEKLPAYYAAALEVLRRREAVYTYALNGENCRVRLCDILYLESQGRMLCLHTTDPARTGCCFYGKMEEEALRLADAGFLRVHKSFLVNMAHIRHLNHAEVRLDDDTLLPVSQRKYPFIRTTYLNWRCRQ